MHYLSEKEAAIVREHFPDLSDEAIEYATNTALAHSKYIFVEVLTKIEKSTFAPHQLRGYCTSCRSNFLLKGSSKDIKQNEYAKCPHCLCDATYKKAWVGHKNLQDSAYFIWYDKSQVDDQVITARLLYCKRMYEDYKNVETYCSDATLYTFEIGESAMYNIAFWSANQRLEKRKSVHIIQTSLDIHYAVGSLKKAVRGTPFEYSGWEKYSYLDHLKYLALFCKYPNIETLSKNGFNRLVSMYLFKAPMHGAINWKARKLHEFFKLSKHEFKKLQESDATGRYVMYAPEFTFGLWIWQQALKEKSAITYKELMAACGTLGLDNHKDRFKELRRYSTIHRIVNYLKKQYEMDCQHYMTPSQVIISWSDYINECIKLEYDLQDEFVLYPKILRKAHRRTSQLIQIKKDEVANKKIEKRYKELEHLVFAMDGFEIRPPKTFKEIVDEGKKLSHCVGGYAKRHSEGQCTLMFIRKVNKPNTPFYTVELDLKDKRIVQVRGFQNKPITDDMREFVNQFKESLQGTKQVEKARKQA